MDNVSSFSVFIMERCEEIIESNTDCVAATKEVIEATKSFFNSLSKIQQKEYLKLESVLEKKNSVYFTTIYKEAYKDGRNI